MANPIEQAVKHANAIYTTGAAMSQRSIEDVIMDTHLDLYDYVQILDALSRKFWNSFEEEYPDCLAAIRDASAAINEADSMPRAPDPMDVARDAMDEYTP